MTMTRVRNLLDQLRTSYWFVPAVMTVVAAAFSFVTIAVDQQVQVAWVRSVGFFWSGDADGARGLLSTVAGSMITVAGVVFSITLVALSLASSQFGPRLLRSFMRDRANQFVLGTFVSTFLYCLLILRAVRSGDPGFVPYISVTTSLILTILSLAVLIFFIHHVAMGIQAPSVIANVAGDLFMAIDDLFPEGLGGQGREPGDESPLPEDFERQARSIPVPYTGYLQALDGTRLLHTATQHNLLVKLVARPGDFVVEGEEALQAWPLERVDDVIVDALARSLVVGRQRTGTQDVEFAIEQLVEVAVRSLSPGINDPFTAITCIDWLGAALCRLATRCFPSSRLYDEDANLRLVVERPLTFPGLLDTAVNQIRQYAGSSVAVRVRLLEMLATVFASTPSLEDRLALQRQAVMIEGATGQAVSEQRDRADIMERYRSVAAPKPAGQ